MHLLSFQLAVPVNNLDKSMSIYGDTLSYGEGSAEKLFHYFVDGFDVQVIPFGGVLYWEYFIKRLKNLKSKGIKCIIEPHIRFIGQLNKRATKFFLDLRGYALEFKSFKDMSQIFAK